MNKGNKNNIWMPLFVGDYLSDTMHLTTQQHGAYFLLLLAYWKNRGPLPEKRIKSICKIEDDSWSIDKAIVEEFFDTVSEPGKWVHHRVNEELEKGYKRHQAAVARGKRGADVRWGL